MFNVIMREQLSINHKVSSRDFNFDETRDVMN